MRVELVAHGSCAEGTRINPALALRSWSALSSLNRRSCHHLHWGVSFVRASVLRRVPRASSRAGPQWALACAHVCVPQCTHACASTCTHSARKDGPRLITRASTHLPSNGRRRATERASLAQTWPSHHSHHQRRPRHHRPKLCPPKRWYPAPAMARLVCTHAHAREPMIRTLTLAHGRGPPFRACRCPSGFHAALRNRAFRFSSRRFARRRSRACSSPVGST